MLEARQLRKIYQIGKREICAVRSVSFSLKRGEILGLVGESGSGKSTLGRLLLRLTLPTSGQIFFEGAEITHRRDRALCRRIQMIFQDPFASLNPRMTIAALLKEPLQIHSLPEEIDPLLELVGLPLHAKGRYPHEFSGGQRQRIGIARALALKPDFLVCDEPISSLDISIQAQIVNLLLRLQKQFGLTYLFISHDLAMIRYVSSRIAVMYAGEFVEIAPTDELYAHPLHPYTQLLLSSIPKFEKKRVSSPPLPPLSIPLRGCPFAHRCPHASSKCREIAPTLKEVAPDHFVACHLINSLL